MSTIKNPVGPESSKVYWRRRALVLLGLVAVVVIIVLIVVRPGSSSSKEETGTTATTTNTTPASKLPPSVPTQPGAVDAEPVTDGEAAACDAASLAVSAVTDADTYAAGVNPQISISITNTSANSCALNVGTAQQVYTITSGGEKYWTSTDCQVDPSDTPTVIDAGATLSSPPFAWDRTRSAPDTCNSPDRPAVPAAGASYHLDVSIGGIASAESKQFILS